MGNDEISTGEVSVAPDEVSIKRPALYVVATPIGNLGDMTPRAIAVLGQVDRLLCEDTRRSRPLLDRFSITTPVQAYHDHNERARADTLVQQLVDKQCAFALISDAGTPLISDPGFRLVRAARQAGVEVITVPGACALVAALSIAGLPTDRFVFEGFLPAQKKAREQHLHQLRHESRTLVFYEAGHRIADLLEALRAIVGRDRTIVLARELTKRFETVYSGNPEQLLKTLAADEYATRGEFVVMLAAAQSAHEPEEQEVSALLETLLSETDRKTALRIAMRLTGLPRNRLYALIEQHLEH